SSSACFSIRSASLFIKTPRCDAVIFFHEPFSNAARAAATALSTSAASASATCVMTSPVEGLIVGKVLPEAASTHLLLMRSLVALTFTVGSITAVAMRGLLRKCRVGQPLATNARGKREKVTPAKGSRQGCRKPVSFRDPLIRLDLQRADVRNAGAHKVEVHFDEVVLDAAGLGSGEDFFPVERIL